jgi:NADP-dependent 3-hydroxy acid dehydrogenase YdfG
MKDRIVVITGASSGIGAALAQTVSRRGASVVVVARRERELGEIAAKCGANAVAVVADVTVRSDVARAFDAAKARFGHVDVWVNNAGRGMSRLVSELTDDDLDEMWRVNVKSVLFGMQAVLPHFRERGRGHIINVSSMLGRVPFAPIRAAYSASKHAMNSLTANLRMELAARYPEIYVTAVHPGVVATEFGLRAVHGGVDSRAFPGAQSADEVAEVIAGTIEKPRADVYTRQGAQQVVVGYFAADDMAEAEKKFGPPGQVGSASRP